MRGSEAVMTAGKALGHFYKEKNLSGDSTCMQQIAAPYLSSMSAAGVEKIPAWFD